LRNDGAIASDATFELAPSAPLGIAAGSLYATSGTVTLDGDKLVWRGAIAPHGMVLVRCLVTAPAGTAPQMAPLSGLLRDAGNISPAMQVLATIGRHLSALPLIRKG
jgi:hypothetical protein